MFLLAEFILAPSGAIRQVLSSTWPIRIQLTFWRPISCCSGSVGSILRFSSFFSTLTSISGSCFEKSSCDLQLRNNFQGQNENHRVRFKTEIYQSISSMMSLSSSGSAFRSSIFNFFVSGSSLFSFLRLGWPKRALVVEMPALELITIVGAELIKDVGESASEVPVPIMFGRAWVAATIESRGAGTPGGNASSPCWLLLKTVDYILWSKFVILTNLWELRWSLRLKRFPQWGHSKGFRPVWMNWCLMQFDRSVNRRPQTLQV